MSRSHHRQSSYDSLAATPRDLAWGKRRKVLMKCPGLFSTSMAPSQGLAALGPVMWDMDGDGKYIQKKNPEVREFESSFLPPRNQKKKKIQSENSDTSW